MRIRTLFLFTALAAMLAPALSHAQESDPPRANVQSGARDGVLKLLFSRFRHRARADDRRPEDCLCCHRLSTLDLFGQDGAQTGAVFYTAYVARDGGPNRPLTFAFNGGPGAASAFLHLGLVGPKVLDFGLEAGRDGANAKLVDNPQSWLDFTDLVLIDPIGTGWSRTAKADDASNYYNVSADAQSIAKAIALYVAHNNRSNSPKYLLGESYGGFRAAKVASVLQESQGIIVA